MRVRKFTAATMKEALSRIRREMGDNALIISTREMNGVMGHRHVEVTAAADDKPAVRAAVDEGERLEKLPPPGLEEQIIKNRVLLSESIKPLKEELFGLRSIVDEIRKETGREPDLEPLREEVRDLKRLVSDLARESSLADGLRFREPLKDPFRRLVASEVEESLDFQLIEMLDAELAPPEKNDAAAALASLRELIRLAKPAVRAAVGEVERPEKLLPPGLEEQIIKNRVLLSESIKPLKEELFGLRSIVDEMRRETSRGTDLEPLREEVRDLKRLVSALAHESSLADGLRFSEPLKDLYRRLVASEVEESLALQLIEMLDAKLAPPEKNDAAAALASLRELICLEVATSKPVAINDGRPNTLAFVGPTGVGKTTTIAKLAARCSLQLKRRVSLITIDTYRIAAVEQLKTYARIMDLPIFVCYSPAEMREAIEQNRDSALILIDTAGHSQTDEEQIADLRNYFADAPEIDVLLVLSATTKSNDLRDITTRFERIGPKKLVFTKLDETTTFGPIVNEAVRTRLPIAYFTNGQNVPDDIETASAAKLAGVLLNDR